MRVEVSSNDERYDDVSDGIAGYDVSDPSDTKYSKYDVLPTVSHNLPITNWSIITEIGLILFR